MEDNYVIIKRRAESESIEDREKYPGCQLVCKYVDLCRNWNASICLCENLIYLHILFQLQEQASPSWHLLQDTCWCLFRNSSKSF